MKQTKTNAGFTALILWTRLLFIHSFSTPFILPSRESPLKYAHTRNRVKTTHTTTTTNGNYNRHRVISLKETLEKNGPADSPSGSNNNNGGGGEKVLEDVDGIGQLTTIEATTLDPVVSAAASSSATVVVPPATTITTVPETTTTTMTVTTTATATSTPTTATASSSSSSASTPPVSASTLVEEFLTADSSSSSPPSTSDDTITVEDILTSASSVSSTLSSEDGDSANNNVGDNIVTKDPPAVISEFLTAPTPTIEIERPQDSSSSGSSTTTSEGSNDETMSVEKVDQSIKKELLDPTIVVEDLIGTALTDPESNGALSTPNLRQEAEAAALESSTSSPVKEVEITKPKPLPYPTVAKILKFAIPSIGVYLCSPLLSLIDTSSVGLLSGTTQQAALSPAVAITDYGALLVAFMYTATTNLVASAKEADQGTEDKPKTRNSLMNALQLSGFVGTGLGLALFVYARSLVKVMIGNDAIDPAVVASAMNYVRVRALGMPAAVIIGAAQSACIGMQDLKSPMYVLVVAALVNLIGDMIFVPVPNAWIGGAAGAAWATVFSQYAAVVMFMKWLTYAKKPKKVNVTNAILELTGESHEGKSRRRQFRKALSNIYAKPTNANSVEREGIMKRFAPINKLFQNKKNSNNNQSQPQEEAFSCKGFLTNQFSFMDLFKFPKLKDAKMFWPYVIPVTTTSIGRVSSYCAMNHVSATLGTLAMAAHQILVSLFYCLTPIADSLSLTGQAFVPGLHEKKVDRQQSIAMRKTLLNFIKVGVLFGGAMSGIAATIPLLARFFTSDIFVMQQVAACAPFLCGAFAVHGIVCACEGIILGQKDLGFLGKAYTAFFFLVPYLMLRVKNAFLAGNPSTNILSVWKIFMGYNIVRATMWVARALQLQIQRSRQAKQLSSGMESDVTP